MAVVRVPSQFKKILEREVDEKASSQIPMLWWRVWRYIQDHKADFHEGINTISSLDDAEFEKIFLPVFRRNFILTLNFKFQEDEIEFINMPIV